MALTSSAEHPQPLRVVVDKTKGWVERLGAVWAEGQLIEVNRRAGSSFHFLTMRDLVEEVSVQVTATSAVLDAAGPLSEGTQVSALLRPTVWAKSGRLAFECQQLLPTGEGRLLVELEHRKRKLQAEGLFDPALKKRLPYLPQGIGLITGAGSAAERDVRQNIALRWPAARIEVRHTLVQGPQAASQIISALAELDANPAVEVIIIARGGGSLEDLMAFSEEALVRAAFACRTPLVSAIGHEPDTPILDLVADLRASTPTDAAKRVVPDAAQERAGIGRDLSRLRQAINTVVGAQEQRLTQLRGRPVLRDPASALNGHFERLQTLQQRLGRSIETRMREETLGLVQQLARLRALSPAGTLSRGYAILTDSTGVGISHVNQTNTGQLVDARLAGGHLSLTVSEIHLEEP